MATQAQKSRKTRVIQMRENQLKSGTKTQKGTSDVKIPLTEPDIKRINKEIETLKSRV
jgi:hypothetical protein